MALNPDNLYLGSARIFIGGTAPSSGGAASCTNDVPSTGGTEVGLTGDDTVFSVSTTIKEIKAEQALSVLKMRTTNEEATLEFTLKEIDFARLKTFMNGTTLTVNEGTTPKTKTVTGGGDISINNSVITMITKEPTSTKYIIIVLYKAVVTESVKINFGKENESMMKVVVRGLEDTTRAVGDRTYQIVQQY